jgi:hypothetical protein
MFSAIVLHRNLASTAIARTVLSQSPGFELGESNDVREARILRQRFASAVIDQLLARIGLKGNT